MQLPWKYYAASVYKYYTSVSFLFQCEQNVPVVSLHSGKQTGVYLLRLGRNLISKTVHSYMLSQMSKQSYLLSFTPVSQP